MNMKVKRGSEIAYLVPPSVGAPLILAVVFASLGIFQDPWFFLAIPFAILGTICSAPNMNLADGFLAVLSALIGFVLAKLGMESVGHAITAGSLAGWFLGGLEKRIRMKPEIDIE